MTLSKARAEKRASGWNWLDRFFQAAAPDVVVAGGSQWQCDWWWHTSKGCCRGSGVLVQFVEVWPGLERRIGRQSWARFSDSGKKSIAKQASILRP